jgi:mannose-6-phosphate isomerase
VKVTAPRGPQVYKDGNHKPEMALALSDFTALCGFVETPQLSAALESTPELRGLVGEAMSSLVASSGESELRYITHVSCQLAVLGL